MQVTGEVQNILSLYVQLPDITNRMTCESIECSYQPWYLTFRIKILTVYMEKLVLSSRFNMRKDSECLGPEVILFFMLN